MHCNTNEKMVWSSLNELYLPREYLDRLPLKETNVKASWAKQQSLVDFQEDHRRLQLPTCHPSQTQTIAWRWRTLSGARLWQAGRATGSARAGPLSAMHLTAYPPLFDYASDASSVTPPRAWTACHLDRPSLDTACMHECQGPDH